MTQQPRKPRALVLRLDVRTAVEVLAYALVLLGAILEPRVIPAVVGIWLLMLVERR